MSESQPQRENLDPTAMPIDHAATILTKVGGVRITAEMIEDDIESGAPVNDEGTLNLVHFAAWLVQELSRGD